LPLNRKDGLNMVIYKNIYLLNTTQVLKILLFLKNNLKKEKALQQKPKGLKLTSSPNKTIFELFVWVVKPKKYIKS
jgi:hypothetical protein